MTAISGGAQTVNGTGSFTQPKYAYGIPDNFLELNFIEQGRFLVELRKRTGLTMKELSLEIDQSDSWIGQRVTIQNLSPEFQKHLLPGAEWRMEVPTALILARLPAPQQAEFGKLVVDGKLREKALRRLMAERGVKITRGRLPRSSATDATTNKKRSTKKSSTADFDRVGFRCYCISRILESKTNRAYAHIWRRR